MAIFRAIWNYRQFIASSVWREFQSRYRASLLGVFWTVAQPLALLLIYTVVFGRVMRPSLPGHEQTPYAFSIYLCAGVIFWTLFAEMLTRLSTVFVDNATLIKKTNFPRVCLPVIATLSALVNFTIIFSLYLAFLILIDHFPGRLLVAVIPVLMLQVLFTLALGIIFGTLNVFFRDIAQFTGVLLQFWFWLTPIVYVINIVPEEYRYWMNFNPIKLLMTAYQEIFLVQAWPNLPSLISLSVGTVLLVFFSALLLLRLEPEMVDEL